ncbi:hypothetical protein TRIATDRAFT_275555 [Trichoderma atroviride IMI 206040]|uniref:Uncharacterized protein n=1 Tax=Hypocrea atroviridis (strain ATCC 20476 / IMI 206040) TaxID=452589 RepID=G9NXU4_HYPAI|nr:uncharacterized protein TRIATDRAFT_275555 [Trichoderma atroviride IMI 206040]EHK44273.1 hypothetical protein TRIATDRAFT_275555 [Trichoderma atroviride IMI 206040]
MKSTASRLDPNWRPEEHIVHGPEGRFSDVVPDASQIMAGTGLQGDETTAGSWVRIVDGSVPRVVAARLEEHMRELVRVGQSWGRGGPREQPKGDLMGKRGSSWGGGAARVKGTKRELSAACDAPAAPWRPWTPGAVYRGGGPEAIRIKLFSKGPRRRALTAARPLDQSYGSLAPCGFFARRAAQQQPSRLSLIQTQGMNSHIACPPACLGQKRGGVFLVAPTGMLHGVVLIRLLACLVRIDAAFRSQTIMWVVPDLPGLGASKSEQ